MSIGKNLNIGGSKKAEKDKVEKVEKPSKKAVAAPAEKKEEATPAVQNKSDDQKMQMINESAAGLSAAPAVDAVAIQRNDTEAPMVAEGQNMLIVFPVGKEEYAIEIDEIKEVVPTPPIALIPQVPSYIMGVANVRGNVLAVVNLEKKFYSGNEKAAEGTGKFVLVINSEEMHVAVNVMNVPNTLIVKDSEIDPPTNVINNSGIGTNHIKGIIKKDKRMIIWIDIHEVMNQMHLEDLT